MNKKQAIEAMMQGKRVSKTEWSRSEYIHYKDTHFVNERNKEENINLYHDENWTIYNPFISFDSAIAHMKEGGQAVHDGYVYKVINDNLMYDDKGSFELCCLEMDMLNNKWSLV